MQITIKKDLLGLLGSETECSSWIFQADANWLRSKLRTPSTAVTWSQLSHDHSCKPRATLCVFSHAKIETASSKGVHCSVSDA